MSDDVVLPAFELDCRDWLVATPHDAGLPEEVDGAPLLAVLSTAVFGPEEFRCASAVLTLGLLDDGDGAAATIGGAPVELVTGDDATACYVAPCPGGDLALLAEFTVDGDPAGVTDRRLRSRIESLMASFRWAA